MTSAVPSVISVEDVRKRYGSVQAVDGVSFEVAAGEVFGLLGPNGAGKTTTVEMLEGLRVPDSGRLTVLGLEVPRSVGALRPRIGVALQTPSLYPRLTVEEVVGLFASFYPDPRSVDEVIAALDLGDRRRALTKDLSGGQKQRLSVALSLVNDPELVFLDEPTTGMDPAARRALWDLIRRLRAADKTVVLTTHYMEEAEELCDRVAIVDHGRIRALDTPLGLIRALPNAYRIVFSTESALDRRELEALPGVSEVVAARNGAFRWELGVAQAQQPLEALVAWAGHRGVVANDLHVLPATLEDVFLSLTGRALRD